MWFARLLSSHHVATEPVPSLKFTCVCNRCEEPEVAGVADRLDGPCPQASRHATNDSRGTAVILAAFLREPAAPWHVPLPGTESWDLVFSQMTFTLTSHVASSRGDDLTPKSLGSPVGCRSLCNSEYALATLTTVETASGIALKVLEQNGGRKGNLSLYIPWSLLNFVPYLCLIY